MDPAFLVPHHPHHHSHHRSRYQPHGRDRGRGHRYSNKPLFPPLPTTVFTDDDLSPDEIICSGSGCDDDDGDNDGDGHDQTGRILAQAEQYLRGTNSIYLHSASLRGPVPESPWRRTGTGIRMARGEARVRREGRPVSDLPVPESSTTTATTTTESASSSANTSLSRPSPPIGSGSGFEDISGFHGCRRHGTQQQDVFSLTFEGVPECTNPGTSGYSSGSGGGGGGGERRTALGKLPSSATPRWKAGRFIFRRSWPRWKSHRHILPEKSTRWWPIPANQHRSPWIWSN